ncbi:B12-binding domain-containing radical SAM protein [bacterium]|nr:B12-binding domain-containing radical SAM protein [bacterium]MBU3956311.1 B12-binding domain-containing radical SAM protein [bacterium]
MNILLISIQKNLDIIGLKSLHYYLLKNGYNSFLLHLPNFNPNDDNILKNIKKFIFEISPGFIGTSLMSVEYYNARDLTKYLKSNFKSIPIIWGGAHPTISPEMCLDYADYVCIGEGERTILDLANAVNNNESIKTVNNLCYIENNQIKKNMLYPLIENLDEIPSYDHIPINSFIQEKNGRIVHVDKKVFKKYDKHGGTSYGIMSSRGCPFSCTYCCNNFLSSLYQTKKVRRRSVKNLIFELEKAVNDNLGIEYINFYDDSFLEYNDEYLKEFCESYKERVRKPFIVRAIPIFITRNKIKYLKGAGLAGIGLGLQSGSDRVCKNIYKRKSLKADFLKAARIIKDFNIVSFYDIILDNPFENEEDGLETIQTLIETPKPFFPQIFSLSLYFGTELYERAKKECPEKIEESLKKKYLVYHKSNINNMIRLSVFLNEKFMNKIVYLYQQNPKGIKFRVILFIANLLSSIIFEPLNYFRIIKLLQGRFHARTLRILPNYLKEGLLRYLDQFKGNKKWI